MTNRYLRLLCLPLVAILCVLGCSENDDVEEAVEEVTDEVEDAADEIQDEIDDATR